MNKDVYEVNVSSFGVGLILAFKANIWSRFTRHNNIIVDA